MSHIVRMFWLAKQLYFSHCAHVKFVSALVMWLAFLCVVVSACSMFLVYKVFTLSGVPTQMICVFVNPTSCPLQTFKNRTYRMVTTD